MTVYGLQVEVSVGTDSGEGALQRLAVAFERAGAEVQDFGKWVFPKLAPVFEEAIDEQFAARGAGPMSGAWAPLTKDYAEWKSGRYPGMPLLELTGELRAALTTSSAPSSYRQWGANEFSFGTMGLEYASYHQVGTGRMPARPPFDFGPTFEQGLQHAAMSGLREAIKAGSSGALELEGEP
jgi:phage gpG-like protein